MKRSLAVYICAALGCWIMATSVRADLLPEEVLVVYNSPSPDATTVRDAYLAAHPGIPSANVLDLNQNYFVTNPANLTYGSFISRIRTPIRNFLSDGQAPEAEDVVSIVLIHGLPHRIYDTNHASSGDIPFSDNPDIFDFIGEFLAGDATCASVDSELVLLWQDLGDGDAGGTMNTYADNMIENPYHASSANIAGFSRANIRAPKTFDVIFNSQNGATGWELAGRNNSLLTPGDMYLVCRIDGHTASDAIAVIDRAQGLVVNQRYTWAILDEPLPPPDTPEGDNQSLFGPSPDPFHAGDDYEETVSPLTNDGWNVAYDGSSAFITEADQQGPVIAFSSFGVNHTPPPADGDAYLDDYQFARGAIFNTMESYNGRAFNNLAIPGWCWWCYQGQLADFIAAGGTFGIGNVWEPLSALTPDSEFLFVNFLVNGLTWAEAAYSALPALSWMQIVVGDPLARVERVVDQPADFEGDGDVDQSDFGIFQSCLSGPAIPQDAPPCLNTDLDGDGDVDLSDFGGLQRCFSGPDVLADPNCTP